MKRVLIIDKMEIPVEVKVDIDNIKNIISPKAIENYVKQKWRKTHSPFCDVKVYQYNDGEKFSQINIPFNEEFRDYDFALYECIKKIAYIEGIDPVDVCVKIKLKEKEDESES